ncbi:alpha-glucosidase [Ekhidna lutea]|uniref:Alpha-glucosidase n=1 Tax=Ekhidna lutea TaxID=447679 RepID=A0A239LVJ5_EKHLU|nr:glycoside hydrolase family 31 protein [Ekhidna lutea]SNT34405.1 alpha-glucosidase [Ekhidna lutea]
MLDITKSERNKRIEIGGNCRSYTISKYGLNLETDQHIYDVTFYNDRTVRVHQKSENEDVNQYAVIQRPSKVVFDVEENEDAIVITSSKFDVVINKKPVLFTFLNKEGRAINQDEPGLGIQTQGEQKTVYKKLQDEERFVGLGEKTGPLDRRGKGYQNWNTDHFAYDIEADPLYASIPFYIGIHSDLSYGIFLDNSYKSHFNFGASNNRFSSFSVDSGDLNYYFFSGSVSEIIQSYTWLTGRMNLPPLWSIGYQQCRYSYYPDTEVLDVAKKFRDKDIPADVIVLDIHYMDQYKIFSWDKERFPNPEEMISQLKDMGFEVVVICDPGIKTEENYLPYDTGKEKDVFLKYSDGILYEGEVWPGWCHFPDFTKPEAREWWKDMMKTYTDIGIKGFWNDMNEIATWGQMLPENIEFDFEGEGGTTRKGRNIFGLQMARSAYESAASNLNGDRPFVLTRAGFAGVQRYSALWTGDNVANDEHMLLGVRMVNSLGLSGIPFSGYDVGGFAGNGQSNLFARWIQVGAFSPFFRGHSMINSHDSEPWSYGEEVEEISANYIRLRYKLLPYIYHAFLQASENGTPIARSLCIDYTNDAKIYETDFENQYLFGDSILVAPLASDQRFGKVYLPQGDWYEFFTDEKIDGGKEMIREYALEHLPLFVKASSIITVYCETTHNSKDVGECLELHVYKGEKPFQTEYYEDDGTTYENTDGMYHRRILSYEPGQHSIKIGTAEGGFNSKIKKLKLILHGFTQAELKNWKDGEVKNSTYSYVKPISNFDPFEKDRRDKLKSENVFTIETAYSNDEMVFNW